MILEFSKNTKKKKINIIPLIDIIFLMLIFFMLATNFIQNEEIDFSIAKSKNESVQNNKTLEIIIKNSGTYLLNSEIIYLNNFEIKLNELWKSKKFDEVFILSENNIVTQNLIDVMDILKRNNINNIFFSDLEND